MIGCSKKKRQIWVRNKIMRKKESKDWPEMIIQYGKKTPSQTIRRAVRKGILRKIAPKIYSSAQELDMGY